MSKLNLVFPSEEYKNQIISYKEEFILNNDSMDGTSNLISYENIDEWLEKLKRNLKEETVDKGLVPATTYLVIREDDKKLVVMIDIRHKLNDYLLNFGGHIGYSVRKTERRKGYATEMLKLSLEKCKELNIEKVLITCNKENIPSAKTILNNNGILENEIKNGDKITQRYWINLKF